MRLLDRIRDVLAAPDVLATPQARILHAILKNLLYSCLVMLPLLGLAFPVFLPRTATVAAILIGATPALMALSKRGHTLLAAWALVLSLLFLQMVLLPTGGGTQAPGLMTFLIITLVAGVLLGRGAGLGIFLVTLVYTLGVALVEGRGGLPAPRAFHSPLSRWGIFVLLLCVTLGLQRLFSREVAHAMDVLEEGKGELERQVTARTAELAEVLGELVQRNEELSAAQERARQATEAKDRFLSIVSHELRSPLTSVRGSLVLLRGGIVGSVPPEGQAMLEIAERNTRRLLSLVDELLDHQKVEAGAFEVAREPIDFRSVLHKAVEGMNGAAAVAGAKLMLEPSAQPLILEGDAKRLEQVVVNLIANAVAHGGGDRRIQISAHAAPGRLRVEVSNDGDPIPESFRDRMFQAFQQGSSARVGSGLGLYLSRAIVVAHGGTIDFRSESGRTIFFFELPMEGPS